MGRSLQRRCQRQPPPPAPPAPTPAPTPSLVEGPGSYDHSTDAEFCAINVCIANFPFGNGSIVQCADGEWSHSGGDQGACSWHGGEL